MEQSLITDINLSTTWVGWLSLAIFVVAYYFIAAEDKYHINKAKPALFAGTIIFMLIGVYYAINGLDGKHLHHEIELLIMEISGIFFFLFVAMTYIETLIERNVFDALRYRLISRGYSYKKLFWITGVIAFWLSPVADNLTTALILSTVLVTLEKNRVDFLVPGAINIVVAANAGGAFSPFGDITTLMVWQKGLVDFEQFFSLFLPSLVNFIIPAGIMHFAINNEKPEAVEENINIKNLLQSPNKSCTQKIK